MNKYYNWSLIVIKYFLLIFIFFIVSFYGYAQIRDDRAWFDPYDAENPLFYSDYLSNLSPAENAPLTFTHIVTGDKEAYPPVKGKIMIIANAVLYSSIQTDIDNYTTQLALEGYNISMYTSSGGFGIDGVNDLRDEIKTFYIANNDLNGCIFIGKLPVAWFQFNNDFERIYALDPGTPPPPIREGVNYIEFPCDLFFMDTDGVWEDNFGYINKKTNPQITGTADSIFDTHNPGLGDTEPEIWISRICANTLDGGTEASFISDYITNKNLVVRNNYSISEYGALYYEDNTSTLSSSDLETSLETIYGAENVINSAPPATNRAVNFTNILNNTHYEWVHIGVRSSSSYHHFGDNKESTTDVIDSDSIPANGQGTKILDVIGSSVNRFIENDYIGGKYLFNSTNTILTVIGSTKSGGLTEHTNDLCSHFSTGTVGDGFLQWMKTLKNENPVISDYRRVAYGMTLIGDPTIRQKAQDGVEVNIQKAINYLLQDGQQLANGSWSNNPSVTAFSALALLNSGFFYDSVLAEASEPGLIKGNWVVSKAVKYLLDQIIIPGGGTFTDDVYGTLTVGTVDNSTYYSASTILPIAAAARNPTIATADRDILLDALEKLRNFLISLQIDNQCIYTLSFPANPTYEGGFNYGSSSTRPDNSNTQFGIMGIRVANETFRILEDPRELDLWDPDGNPATDDGTFNKCVDTWLETTRFEANGEHGYLAGNTTYNSSMTAAALWTYAMCGYPTDGPEIKYDNYEPTQADQDRSGHAADALAASAARLEALGSFNGFSHAGVYYFTYTLAKALAMNRQDQIVMPTSEDFAWYPAMCDFLINGNNFAGENISQDLKQNENGSWPGGRLGDILGTVAGTQLNTAWNINTLRIQKLPGEVNANGPEQYTLAFSLMSYSDLHVYDNEGRHVGRKKLVYTETIANEEVEKVRYFAEEQIPGSSYRIYELDKDDNYIREASFDEFEDGIIPEADPTNDFYGYAQVVKIKNAQPDSLRIEIQGTSTGTYDLAVELAKGDNVIKTLSYNDHPIQAEQVNHCTAKLVNIEGMEMYNEPIEESAVAWIDETLIREYVTPGTENYPLDPFEIRNLAQNVEMRNVSVSCTNIQGSNGVIINAIEDIHFSYDTLIAKESFTTVNYTITVPANFIGPGEGEIKVTSANGNVKTRRLRILTNRPPNAEAGNDQILYAGASTNFEATISLDGSGSSDAEDDELNFKWYAGSTTGVLLAEGETPEITLGLGIHTIVLVVEDSRGEKDWDDVVIQVLNRTPTANAGEDISVFAGAYGLPEAKVQLNGAASTDPESDPLTYQWYENEILIAEGPTPEVILAAGIHTISLVVDDTVNISQPDDVIVTVIDAVPATMWMWPNRISTRGCWGLFNTTITLPAEIKREDIDDSFRIQLFTKDGESIESFYDRIFPYLKINHNPKDKNEKKLMENKGLKCHFDKFKKVKIVSVFFKRYLLDLLEEEGDYTLYAVGRLKSGEYFNAATKMSLFDPFHYHYHPHHK